MWRPKYPMIRRRPRVRLVARAPIKLPVTAANSDALVSNLIPLYSQPVAASVTLS